MNREPVRTKADLDALDDAEIVEGFVDGMAGEPEPGNNRSRAYWHGWRVGMMDSGRLEIDADHRHLVHDVAPGGRLRLRPSLKLHV